MNDLPFSLLAWKSLATMIQGQIRYRPAGWAFKPRIQVEGTSEGCRVRGSMLGVDAPEKLPMDGRPSAPAGRRRGSRASWRTPGDCGGLSTRWSAG